jgi:ribulose 1,5-bisphosphate carboxylase large subunit-like protein
MRIIASALAVVVLISGCQTAEDVLTTNTAPDSVSGPAASAIAGDMAARLAEQIGTTTTIKMREDRSNYAEALEAALKGWGYAIVKNGNVRQDQKAIAIAYSLDRVDGQVLARLTTPSLALGRAYTATEAGATAASPLSVMNRD